MLQVAQTTSSLHLCHYSLRWSPRHALPWVARGNAISGWSISAFMTWLASWQVSIFLCSDLGWVKACNSIARMTIPLCSITCVHTSAVLCPLLMTFCKPDPWHLPQWTLYFCTYVCPLLMRQLLSHLGTLWPVHYRDLVTSLTMKTRRVAYQDWTTKQSGRTHIQSTGARLWPRLDGAINVIALSKLVRVEFQMT